MPKLLIGLGNPGSSYAGHRHNVGFMLIDLLAQTLKASEFRSKFSGHLAEAQVAGEKIFLFKPQSYMNCSGEPAGAVMRFYKIPLEDVMVFHDDLDLAFGKLRTKQGGGHGGHNGLKSLDACLGEHYWRVRLGIGHPGDKDMVSSYVLHDFSKEEWPTMEALLRAITAESRLLIQCDMQAFTNAVALALKPKASPQL